MTIEARACEVRHVLQRSGRKIIHNRDMVLLRQVTPSEMRADKSGTTGDQNLQIDYPPAETLSENHFRCRANERLVRSPITARKRCSFLHRLWA